MKLMKQNAFIVMSALTTIREGAICVAYCSPEGKDIRKMTSKIKKDISSRSESDSVAMFSNICRSFMKTNTHYTEANQLYEAYTLKQVLAQLFGDSALATRGE